MSKLSKWFTNQKTETESTAIFPTIETSGTACVPALKGFFVATFDPKEVAADAALAAPFLMRGTTLQLETTKLVHFSWGLPLARTAAVTARRCGPRSRQRGRSSTAADGNHLERIEVDIDRH